MSKLGHKAILCGYVAYAYRVGVNRAKHVIYFSQSDKNRFRKSSWFRQSLALTNNLRCCFVCAQKSVHHHDRLKTVLHSYID